MKREFKNIARVVKAHGKYGEVLVHELQGLPFLLREGTSYALTPPALKRDRFLSVAKIGECPDGWLVKFHGINSISDAESLAGCYVLACTDDFELGAFDVLYDDLIGCEVVDARFGNIGTITEIMETPAHDIWCVQGSFGEVLIPVVEEIVLNIPENGPIEVDLPQGLIGET